MFTHIEVGLAILSGEADTGIATAAVSTILGLDFVPVTRERFDMILDQSVFFQKGVQALMEVLNGDMFRKRVEKSGELRLSKRGSDPLCEILVPLATAGSSSKLNERGL